MNTIEIINSSRLSGRYTYTSSSSSRKSHSSKLLRRNLRTDNLTRSKSSITMMCLMVSSICIILFASFTTSNAFVPSTSSRITIISSRTPSRSTSKAMSSTQLEVAKTGGKLISTEQEFSDNVLSKDLSRPVLVFFTAPWCGPCRLTIPVVKEVMKQYSGELDVVEVNTDDLMEVAEKSGVLSIPTIQFYYNGIALETHSLVGCVAKSVLSNAIDKVIEDVAQMK